MQNGMSYLMSHVCRQGSTSVSVDLKYISIMIEDGPPLSRLGNRGRKIAKIAALVAKQNNLNRFIGRFHSNQFPEFPRNVIHVLPQILQAGIELCVHLHGAASVFYDPTRLLG